MSPADVLGFASGAIRVHRFRTLLIVLAIAIGVAAVVLLTALGDSARRYVTAQFQALGTNLLIILPGRSETTGGPPPMLGETPRDLTLQDALALLRSRHIVRVAPVILGSAPVAWGGLEREVDIFGSTADLKTVRHLSMSQGQFLPLIDPERARPVCVIGPKLRDELFGNHKSLGEWLRIGDRRFRVVGVLAPEGRSIGVDFDDNAIIPVASAQALFDSPSLFRVLAEARSGGLASQAAQDIREIIKMRHEGEDDVTVIAQDSVVSSFDRILRILTLALGGIASISLIAAGTLIMNVMLVSVSQRTAEIGLLKSVGATARQIRLLFLTEAAMLSVFGAFLGIGFGFVGAWVVRALYPLLPVYTPIWSLGAAVAVSLVAGLLFGVMPAGRAARLDPVRAFSQR